LAIVLSVFRRFTGTDYPYGIYKLFFKENNNVQKGEITIKHQTCSTHASKIKDNITKPNNNIY